jgi:peptide/nickel transport system substrate-binding protein
LRAYLFADIRGFTSFTHRNGGERAAALVRAFTGTADEVIRGHGGLLVSTWGDQVLGEFGSACDAVLAAIELQRRCIEATVADPSTPMCVGIGLDAGDQDGAERLRAGAGLNLASRLCDRAAAGQVLATRELGHLAGAVPGVTMTRHGHAQLKGVPHRVQVVAVSGPRPDRRTVALFRAASTSPRERRRRRRRLVTATAAVLALLAGSLVWVVRESGPAPVQVPANGIVVLDARSGQPTSARAVGGELAGMASTRDTVWVAERDSDQLAGVGRSGDSLRLVGVGDRPVAVAADSKDIWVADNGIPSAVTRVSVTTGKTLETIDVGNLPSAITVGAGAVWVAEAGDAQVRRIDPTSGRVTGYVGVGDDPDALAFGAGRLWVANGRDGTVTPVDPTTLTAESPIPVGDGPRAVAVTAGAVWVANSLDLTVSRIDLATRMTSTLQVGDTPVAETVAHGSVWVANEADGTVSRIDPVTRAVEATVRIGASPRALVAVGSTVWAATAPFAAASHRGGVLTVSGNVPDNVDPNAFFGPQQIYAYDGLLGLRRAPGASGYDIVPDLAVAIPHADDNGLRYTFRLRSGIRYSDGRLVTPADVKHGYERALAIGQNPDLATFQGYYRAIVGAPQCLAAHTGRCSLPDGITTDAQTVTFHLSRPDPELLSELSVPIGVPTPPEVGFKVTNTVPGTGPYAVVSFQAEKSLVLTRNRYFRQWSAAAQPTGFPNRIVLTQPADRAARIDAVERGDADITELAGAGLFGGTPSTLVDPLRLRYPDRIKEDFWAYTQYLPVNTRRRPFSDARARQALAYALDRHAIARLWGSTQPACQLVPPDYPGYTPYCPYTVDPDTSGTWKAPDLDKARALVTASGTSGMDVQVYIMARPPYLQMAELVVTALDQIGYHAHLHPESPQLYGTNVVGVANSPMNVAGSQWAPDFPASSNYYVPILTCAGYPAQNWGGFCDPAMDSTARTAQRLQLTNPGGAQVLWRRLYRRVVDTAAVIPTHNENEIAFLSARIGNYQSSAFWGPLLDQMWVR